MSWVSFGGSLGVSDTNKTSNTQSDYTGTTTPILSPQWNGGYSSASGNVGANGATPAQTSAMNFATSQMQFGGYQKDANGNVILDSNGQPVLNNPAVSALTSANANLQPLKTQLGTLNNYWGNAAAQPNATAAGATSTAATAAAPPSVMSPTSASDVAPYSSLYGSQVTDPALAAFDYGIDRNFSALDARTAGQGGFANSRSGLAYSDLGSQSELQRAQLAAQLNSSGLTSALGFASGDAGRQLQANTSNASNVMGTNEFNANQIQGNNIFNAGQIQGNNQFNTTAGIQQRQLSDSEVTSQQTNLSQQAGLTQQQAQNIVTANGINTDAANALFTAGQITQQQLTQILQLAATANGQSTQANSGSSTNSNEIAGKTETHGGFG